MEPEELVENKSFSQKLNEYFNTASKENPMYLSDYLWKIGSWSYNLAGIIVLGWILFYYLFHPTFDRYHKHSGILGSYYVESPLLIALLCWIFGLIAHFWSAEIKHDAAEKEKVRAHELEQVQLAHQRQLELIEANKQMRTPQDRQHELTVLDRNLAHTIALEVTQENGRANQRSYAKEIAILKRIDNLIQTIILSKAELRDHPLGQEIVAELKSIYEDVKNIDKNAKVDNDEVTAMIEKALLFEYAKRRGIPVDKL